MDLFDPIPALNHWFTVCHRRHAKTNHKAKQQEWFVGVFNEAKKLKTGVEKFSEFEDNIQVNF